MDANQLALDILAFLKENLAVISHQETMKGWEKAMKKITPTFEEKAKEEKIALEKAKGMANFTAQVAQDRHYCLEIAQMRLETSLRDEYDLLLTKQDKRLAAVLAKMSANSKKGRNPDLKSEVRESLKKQNRKLMDKVRKDTERHSLLRADLYMFIAYIQKFKPAA